MPVFRSRTVLEVARGIRAFLNLEAGLVRGSVPDPEQVLKQLEQTRSRVERLQRQLYNKDRQLEQMRKQLSDESRTATAMRTEPDAGAGDLIKHKEQDQEALVGDAREHLIGRVVKGKSFAEVGGLYDTTNEKISLAHSHGAAALTMIDSVPEGNELWQAFSERMRYFGISKFDTISESILDLAYAPETPRYDVVYCTDVLPQMPDPERFLSALHRITRKHLVLGSAVTTMKISNNGVPTVDSLKAMCTSAGFDCDTGAYYRNDNAYVLLLSRRSQG